MLPDNREVRRPVVDPSAVLNGQRLWPSGVRKRKFTLHDITKLNRGIVTQRNRAFGVRRGITDPFLCVLR